MKGLFVVWMIKGVLPLLGVLANVVLRLGHQSKHFRDIAAIFKAGRVELDLDYIEQRAAQLGLNSLWEEMLDNVS